VENYRIRHAWRITNLLLKIKGRAHEEKARENRSRSFNVNENTAAYRIIEKIAIAVEKTKSFKILQLATLQ
jgi:hypothetical protein